MKLELMHNQQGGHVLYINNHRVAGAKPWGGGLIIATWDVKPHEILKAMGAKYKDCGVPDEG